MLPEKEMENERVILNEGEKKKFKKFCCEKIVPRMKRPAVKLTEELSEVKLQTSPENGS
jgi:hypothetical protein